MNLVQRFLHWKKHVLPFTWASLLRQYPPKKYIMGVDFGSKDYCAATVISHNKNGAQKVEWVGIQTHGGLSEAEFKKFVLGEWNAYSGRKDDDTIILS